ncbi:MAG TPA: nucleoside recognition protein [Candidatus Fusicatenibacter merdavium]|uniref:Nucleoside recognition protein n=1 Tax=Candidatus Fusicatenibacter merdavium TaxID=2838600 RepID=A0A9D1XB80_9FIRM|nr:nucleoside recognition protein [Candidatus Fusicatenibacter merdavium]
MNYLWGGMMIIGIVYGALTGNLDQVTNGAINASKEAVTLAIALLGVTAMWSGLMEIASGAGMIDWITKKIRPVLRFLFPGIPEGHPALESISVNMIANFFGLGAAATPAGLKAMEELKKLEDDRRTGRAARPVRGKGIASNEMCTFLIVNISSLQLIPVNVIAYRGQYGSVNPAAIVGPAIAATAASTLAGVVFSKIMDRGKR